MIYIIIGVPVLLLLYIVLLYNDIIRSRNETKNAFGSIDAMLKKRYDLIPNLVETVKEYMTHEKTILTDITRLRSKLTDNLSNNDALDLHNDISKKLNEILISVENYPDLKASQNFLKLQASWNETEEQISASRRFYNTAVTDYNNSIQTFPSNLISKYFGFTPKIVFEMDDSERKNIHAEDLFKN
jgi:LemA protein